MREICMRSSNSASSLCIRSHIAEWPLKRNIRHSVVLITVQGLVHQIACIEHLLIGSGTSGLSWHNQVAGKTLIQSEWTNKSSARQIFTGKRLTLLQTLDTGGYAFSRMNSFVICRHAIWSQTRPKEAPYRHGRRGRNYSKPFAIICLGESQVSISITGKTWLPVYLNSCSAAFDLILCIRLFF